MGSMRKGLGGFVGGLKNLVQGVFSSWHSITSIAPTDTPDCFVVFVGALDTQDAVFVGQMTDTLAEIGALDVVDATFTGALDFADAVVISGIDPENPFIGTLTDETNFIGSLCDD